jgi:hypothetical protein
MKQALISIIEPRETGYRVAQVVAEGETFPVSPELFWALCADDVVADQFWYDPQDQTTHIKPIPPHIPTAEENKSTAMGYLAATDWVNQPDVTNPDISPHLLNHAEFITYRSQIRAIAINPTAGVLTWPIEPTPQWSSV